MTYRRISDQLADHLQSLNPDQFQQFMQTGQYLHEVASRPSGLSPEGSVASIINKQAPHTRKAFKMLGDLVETPREMPFEAKKSERDYYSRLGLDPDSSTVIKEALDGQYVADALQSRMGTDSDREPEPITTRDILSAAYDAHTDSEGGEI